jgi:CRP-like cAMP-binding protein
METKLQSKLSSYFEKYKTVSFDKGEIILKPGDKPNYIGFIKTGYVRLYLMTEDGKEITLQFFKPIFWLTQIFAMTGIENKYYFEAMTPVEMYTAPIKETTEFLRSDHELSAEIMKIVLTGFLDTIDRLGYLLAGDAYGKVAMMVALLSKRSKEEGPIYGKIDFGITHKLIASLTGLTRETVTLQMLKLEKEGLIVNKNRRVIVKDWDKLYSASK